MVLKAKSLETKRRLGVVWGWEWEWGSSKNGNRESFWVYENVLKLDYDDGFTTLYQKLLSNTLKMGAFIIYSSTWGCLKKLSNLTSKKNLNVN